MGSKLLGPILTIFATTRWSIGNPHPTILHGNIDMSPDKMVDVHKAKYKDNGYPYTIKDMMPKLERKSGELGIILYNSWT